MARNGLVVVALVLVGVALWLAVAWPAANDDALPPPPEALVNVPLPLPLPKTAPEPSVQPIAALAPQAPAPPAPAPAQARVIDTPEMFANDQGPVDEYRKLFESEPRASSSNEIEVSVRKAFAEPGTSPELFRSVLCRQTICKLELNWAGARLGSYIAGVTRIMSNFTAPIGVSPQGRRGEDDERQLDLYLKLKPADQRNSPPIQMAPPLADPGANAPQPSAAQAE